jgi:hypothetical protein
MRKLIEYTVWEKGPKSPPILKQKFNNRRGAEKYAVRLSKMYRDNRYTIESNAKEVEEENKRYKAMRVQYDLLCKTDPDFEYFVSFKDFASGGLKEASKEVESRSRTVAAP